jgi:hypothetical protein
VLWIYQPPYLPTSLASRALNIRVYIPLLIMSDNSDNNITSSTLDSELFTSDQYLESTPSKLSSSTTTTRRKRKLTAKTTWDYAQDPKPKEPKWSANGCNKIFYCKLCVNPSYNCHSLMSAWYHLKHTHQITVTNTETKAKKLRTERLENIWAKTEENNQIRVKI